jgi:hypothetical protein
MSLHEAVLFDDAHEPLLERPKSDEHHQDRDHHRATRRLDAHTYDRFQASSLALGLMVGFFIQFSTLGANYLVISIWGPEGVLNSSNHDILVFSLVWSFFTSTMAIAILAFLRNLVLATYDSDGHEEDAFDDMILQLECRFVVGALVGVCTAWAATDLALGLSTQVLYSLATLVIALGWCRVMVWCFSPVGRKVEAAAAANKNGSGAMMIV